MGQKLDRAMYEISVVYIALPVFIFLAGWLRLVIAVPVCIVFLISMFLMLRNRPEPVAWHLTAKDRKIIIAALLILALWVFFSGIGGFSFQNLDYDDRNAILRDLINKQWPVIYNYPAGSGAVIAGLGEIPLQGILSYYIAFWLPAALFGKLFGWYAANAFIYFWALTGAGLVVYYIFRTLRRASIWSVCILIFFSGLDIVGYILRYKGAVPSLISHIEWWSGYQFSSNTTLLYWVFNQALVPWLAVLLLLNMKNTKSLFFMYAMLLLYGPFPFLGMLPFVLWKAYQGYPIPKGSQKIPVFKRAHEFAGWFGEGIKRAVSFENIAGGISVLFIVFLYFSNNVSSGRYMGFNTITPAYFPFFIFEAGLYLIILFVYFRKYPVYWICLGSLLLIPLFQVGIFQDFCMRVSIPALFMIQLMIQRILLERKDTAVHDEAISFVPTGFLSFSERDRKLLVNGLAVLVCIGAVSPIHEIARSLWYTFPEYAPTHDAAAVLGETLADSGNTVISSLGNQLLIQNSNGQLWYDDKNTLQNIDETTTNYIASTKDNTFCRYLARQS